MNHLIFVYGTLKQGFQNHHLLHGGYFLGTGHTVEQYAMFKHAVPYVIKGRPLTQIYGELFSIHQSILETLDLFEGNPVWNFREQVEVILEKDGSKLTAWMYFNDTAVGDPVTTGIYTMD